MIEVEARPSIPLKPGPTQNTRWARHTPEGTLLVCSEVPGVVTEYDRTGKIIWDYLIKTRVYGAIRLANGNTLIASGGGKSVVEVTPERKVVWEIKNQVAGAEHRPRLDDLFAGTPQRQPHHWQLPRRRKQPADL